MRFVDLLGNFALPFGMGPHQDICSPCFSFSSYNDHHSYLVVIYLSLSLQYRPLEYLWKSRGIERTRELAEKHSSLAAAAIDSLPDSNNEERNNQRIIRKE
ncbi:hypothetical protein SLA2020_320000 [Shorea laevis]